MGQPLTEQQLAYLASEFGQMASTLQTFQTTLGANPAADLTTIEEQISKLTDISNKFANQAAATAFDNSAHAYVNMRTATENANEVAASLKQEAAQVSRIGGIAAGMIGLANVLTGDSAATVGSAIAALAKEVHS